MATKLSDTEKSGLSDEELEALDDVEEGAPADTAGEVDADDDGAAPAASDDDDDDDAAPAADDASADDKAGDDDAAAAPAAAEGKPADAQAADAGKPAVPAAVEDADLGEIEQTLEAPPIALVTVPDVSNYEAERGVLLDERKELRAKHRDGDISSDEYDDKLDAINDRIAALDRTKADAEHALKQNESVQTAQYQWTIQQVKKDFKSEGIDYDKNPVLMQMWDTNVKQLAAKEENATKTAEWFLRAAHKLVKLEVAKVAESLGFMKGDAPAPKGEKPAAPAVDKKAAVKAATAARKPDTSKVKGVGTLPAAEASDVSGDEFSDLDNLTGVDLERALAKMPEDTANKYLRG